MPPSQQNPTKPPQRSGKARKVFLILIAGLLIIATTATAAYWWHNRPITPTVLDAKEQKTLDKKLHVAQQRDYEPGSKTIILSEREVNAMFHHNTGLGDKVKFEFARNAIHARIRTELDPNLPVLGGKTLKAKARFKLTDNSQQPAIILDDVTVWGISLPNAWLADLKGQNLLADLGANNKQSGRNILAKGIKTIEVNNGEIKIELEE